MTGKEALEYIIKLVLSHTSTGRHSGKSYTQKALYKLSEKLELLEKYKLAFEIFKGKEVNVYSKFDGNTQYIITLNKNEYELLEELMKNE